MDKNSQVEAVQQQGLRLTSQRRLVMEILQQSDEHLDAEMVYERARLKDPRISLATIYRTLALFKLLGLVEEHQFGENHGHFETATKTPHYHFACTECGQVIEFSDPDVEALALRLCQQAGHALTQVKLELVGTCSTCQAKKEAPEESAIQPLSATPAGSVVRIVQYEGGHDFASRAISMGLPLGAEAKVIQNYGHGPLLVGIQGSRIALGRGEAAKIKIRSSR
ncbi:MAG: transcriptional repressor [Anaerolineales bacterium]|jgi:Fe2+ or Zn2+ uptake regulation protein/Fe2+ transport system protein FeoA|nr:transcriptional repressor [Anaerolineales bacterium]